MPEFGPYEQPGWPSTLPYFQPAKTFQNAFAIGAEINRRKQQMENQMMQMSMRAQQNDIMTQIRVADYQRKLEQGDQRLALGLGALNMREAALDLKRQTDQENMESITNAAHGLRGIDFNKVDNTTPNAIYKVMEDNTRAAKVAPYLFKSAFSDYNHGARISQNTFSRDQNDLLKDIKASVGRGQSDDVNLIYNLDQWKPQWIDKQGNLIAPPADEKQAQAEGSRKTGKVFTLVPNSVAGQPPVPITLPATKVIELNRRLKALDARKSTLPQQVTNEYATAMPSRGDYPQPGAGDIAYLKAHPEKSAAFEARFGPGTASQITTQ